MKLPLTITALLLATACAPKPDPCNPNAAIEAQGLVVADTYEGSKGRIAPPDLPQCAPTPATPFAWSDDNGDPDTPRRPTTPSSPSDPTDPSTPSGPNPDDPSDPTGPETPDEPDRPRPEKAKGNNGWGNGDDAAPGRSRDRNNAENGERTQRNHGRANRN